MQAQVITQAGPKAGAPSVQIPSLQLRISICPGPRVHGNKLPGPPPSFPHKLSPCPSRMAGWLGARHAGTTAQELTAHLARCCADVQLGIQGSRGPAEPSGWGQAGTSFPSQGHWAARAHL